MNDSMTHELFDLGRMAYVLMSYHLSRTKSDHDDAMKGPIVHRRSSSMSGCHRVNTYTRGMGTSLCMYRGWRLFVWTNIKYLFIWIFKKCDNKDSKVVSCQSPVRWYSTTTSPFSLEKNSKRRASSPAGPAVPNAPETVFQPSVGLAPHPLLRRPFLGSSLHLKKDRSNEGKSWSLEGWKGKWDFFKPNHPAIWCVSMFWGWHIYIYMNIPSQSRLVRKHATSIAGAALRVLLRWIQLLQINSMNPLPYFMRL